MANLLAQETSPYLLQHADNPVDWRPWGPDALKAARDDNKPVLLSVGYAACHWCHVMAHESFENPEIATVMNQLFVNIKVDREERPDLDSIYQRALQLLGQQGGWPLTMFLTPEGEPFWGGTYFPPESRQGRPGFPDVLRTIHDYWTDKPDAVRQNVAALGEKITDMGKSAAGGEIALDVIGRAAIRLAQEFDQVHGGIGNAPKFPNPSILELLWRTAIRTDAPELRGTVTLTLTRMSQGGIYDHLGGGFSRYSTDARWLAPHFEKMLYDNAQLIDLLCWAWQDTGDPLYEQRVRETIDWTLREMIADGGAFAATLDADSEGEEGRFYVWSHDQINRLLGPAALHFNEIYDVRPGGNWEGKTILNRIDHPALLDDAGEAALAACRITLLADRASRVRPAWDDKVLADWNGLMIAAMAGASRLFDEPDWLDAASCAFDFVTQEMTREGRLYHAARDGKLNHTATLDDYAMMARAALALFEATGNPSCLATARGWVDVLDAHYWDDAGGGYFFTADDAEALIVRTKSAEDQATPSGNGVIAAVLARLWYLTGEMRYRDRANAVLNAFSGALAENFFPLATLMNSAEFLRRATQLIIVGDRDETTTRAMLRAAASVPAPGLVLTVIAPGAALPAGHPASGKTQ
ncbi:MAG: thioredoxin domain-containing protein, partial [Alphaproteobacteria bacterium]